MGEPSKGPVDRMVDAYEAMLQRVHEAADSAEQKTLPWLRETLADARERAVELGELTREESEKVARYVERDLHEAANFIAETGQEFRDWLNFDWRLVQSRMLEMFAGMADQTSQALKGFADQARRGQPVSHRRDRGARRPAVHRVRRGAALREDRPDPALPQVQRHGLSA